MLFYAVQSCGQCHNMLINPTQVRCNLQTFTDGVSSWDFSLITCLLWKFLAL